MSRNINCHAIIFCSKDNNRAVTNLMVVGILPGLRNYRHFLKTLLNQKITYFEDLYLCLIDKTGQLYDSGDGGIYQVTFIPKKKQTIIAYIPTKDQDIRAKVILELKRVDESKERREKENEVCMNE